MCVCVSSFSGKIKTLTFQLGYWQTSNYTRKKNNVEILLKPFGSKVIKIVITHSYRFTTLIKRWNEGNNESKYGNTNTSDPVSWLSLAKKHFKPKAIEVVGATTPPLMQYLAPPTGMCTCMLTKRHGPMVINHMIEVIQYGDFRGRIENFFIVFRRKTENKM